MVVVLFGKDGFRVWYRMWGRYLNMFGFLDMNFVKVFEYFVSFFLVVFCRGFRDVGLMIFNVLKICVWIFGLDSVLLVVFKMGVCRWCMFLGYLKLKNVVFYFLYWLEVGKI